MSAEVRAETSDLPVKPRFRLHWHVILTHFPVSGFAGAFLFMVLHLVSGDRCMAGASYVALIASTAILLPTTLTGWLEWRKTYRSFMNKVFRNKIRVSLAMIPVSLGLTLYQTIHQFEPVGTIQTVPHAVYFSGLAALLFGAMAEGYWGGRLHHR